MQKNSIQFMNLIITVLAVLIIHGRDDENSTDFTIPGSRGAVSTGSRHALITETIHNDIPNPVPCERDFVILGSAVEVLQHPETCEGYDFTFYSFDKT